MNRKRKGLVKGASSGVIFSIAIHAGILLLAGGWVVVNITKKEEKKFVPPPPVERPKMDVKKPRPKIKRAPPPRGAQRIVSKGSVSAPDIQLPDVAGVSSGLRAGMNEFSIAPNVAKVSLLGGTESVSVGNDFTGTFYSFSYDRLGNEAKFNKEDMLHKFHENDWNPYTFSQIYRAPQKLYTTHFVMPPFRSIIGPRSFGINDPNFNPEDWTVLYTGKIASPKDGRFRFWGQADEYIFVRINKKVVLKSTWEFSDGLMVNWNSESDESLKYYMGNSGAVVGDWFEMKAGEPVLMEVLIGDRAKDGGGLASFLLAIEDGDEDYSRDKDGRPYLPAFKTAEFPERVKAEIEYTLIRGDVDLNSDLMFNVY